MKYGDCIDEKRAEFESGILNTRVVSIKNVSKGNLKKIAEKCKEKGFDYIVCQIGITELDLINEMLSNGFRIYGFPVILKKNIEGEYKKSSHIRAYNPNDLKPLKSITKGAFQNVHWYNNRNLDKRSIDSLYIKWLENSCNGMAEIVFVYEKENRVLGYISCKRKGKIGVIDLVAVHTTAKKKGIGKELVNAAQEYFKDNGVKEMEVKTEITNSASLNLYTRRNFKIVWVGLNINKWLK